MRKSTERRYEQTATHHLSHGCIDPWKDGRQRPAKRHAQREYESLHSKLAGNAWICGRTTMLQQHFADAEPFVFDANTPAGDESVHIARKAESYGEDDALWIQYDVVQK